MDWKSFLEERYHKISSSLKIFEKSHIINIKKNDPMIYFRESPESEIHSVKVLIDDPVIKRLNPEIIPLQELS